jgi:hypothetical protein
LTEYMVAVAQDATWIKSYIVYIAKLPPSDQFILANTTRMSSHEVSLGLMKSWKSRKVSWSLLQSWKSEEISWCLLKPREVCRVS